MIDNNLIFKLKVRKGQRAAVKKIKNQDFIKSGRFKFQKRKIKRLNFRTQNRPKIITSEKF